MSKKALRITIISLCIVALSALVIYDALKKDVKELYTNDFAMGTIVTQHIYSGNEEINQNIIDEITRLENDVISWRVDGSAVAELNKSGRVENAELSQYIKTCLEVSENSDGRFDITCGKLTRLWNIGSDDARLPSQAEIDEALKNVDYSAVKVLNDTVTVKSGQSIDMGAVGKGIACDRAYEIIKNSDVKGAAISVGGSLLIYGEKEKDEKWTVGIRNPFSEEVTSQMGTLHLNQCFVSTSGNYERFFEYEGKRYHHILDAVTGYPCENELSSVTVIAQSGLLSDALSTVCFISGYEKSLEILSEYNAQAVFIFNDRTVKTTQGLNGNFEIIDDTFKMGA